MSGLARAPGQGQPLRNAVGALRHRDFRIVWLSAVASNTGSFMQAVTVPFVIYQITGSSVWLGISSAATMIPQVLVGPLAGVLADTRSRKQVLVAMQVVQMIAASTLWGLWSSGMARPGLLLVVVVVGSAAAGINLTSWQSFVPSLVPREDLMGALRLNTIQFSLSAALGPALAGAALSLFGAGFTFSVNAISFLLVIAALLSVASPVPPSRVDHPPPFRRQLADGIRYVRARRRLVHCVATTFALSSLVNAVVQLSPAIATDQLRVGGSGYGVLLALQGTGAVLMALLLAVHADRVARPRVAVSGLVAAALALATVASTRLYGVALGAFFCLGLAHVMIVVSLNTAMQFQLDDAYRGRVLSIYLMGVQLGPPIGTTVLGKVAEQTSTQVATGLAAGLLLLYTVVVIVRFDRLRGLDVTDGRADGRADDRPAAGVTEPTAVP